jgi:hypothetical protein
MVGAGLVTSAALAGALFAGGLVCLSVSFLFNSLAGDPPRPYQQVVRFRKRTSNPPGMDDPLGERAGIVIQSAVFSLVTAQGLLEAMERRAGALLAGDLDWAIAHNGSRLAAFEQMRWDLAISAAALRALKDRLEGTPSDVEISIAGRDAVRQRLSDPEVIARLVPSCQASGLSDEEIDRSLEQLRALETYQGLPQSPTRLSAFLESQAYRLYNLAMVM